MYLRHMPGEQAGVDVVAAAGGGADDHRDLPAFVELRRRSPGPGRRGMPSSANIASRRKQTVHVGPSSPSSGRKLAKLGTRVSSRLEPACGLRAFSFDRITRASSRLPWSTEIWPTTISPSSAAASTAPASRATPPAGACACCCWSRTTSARARRRPRPSSFTAACAISSTARCGWCARRSPSARCCCGWRRTSSARCASCCRRCRGRARRSCCGSGCFSTTGSAREKSCPGRAASTSPTMSPASRCCGNSATALNIPTAGPTIPGWSH